LYESLSLKKQIEILSSLLIFEVSRELFFCLNGFTLMILFNELPYEIKTAPCIFVKIARG